MNRLMIIAFGVAASACAGTGEVGADDKTDSGSSDGGGSDGPGDDGGDDGGGDDGGGDDGTGSADGDLYINEFMASNTMTYPDEAGAFPDWIEVYNGGSETVDLGGWTITDDLDKSDKHPLSSTLSIGPGEFLVLFADDDEEEGPQHVGFNLSAEGESIGLYRPDGGAVDEVDFGAMGQDVSMARTPDGSSNWEVTDLASPGESNGG